MFNNLAILATAGAPSTTKGVALYGAVTALIPILLLIYIFYEMWSRRKVTKKHQDMLNSIKEGDKVVTIGGLRGEIATINDKTFELKVDKGIRLEFERRALARKIEN